jgi:acetyltransferase-like isoleucine patch superfamily enzyme
MTKKAKIIIGDNSGFSGTSIGSFARVEIGENALIGENSVVTKNIPPNTIAVGNPCEVIKYLNND